MRIAVVDDENYICSLLEEYILDNGVDKPVTFYMKMTDIYEAVKNDLFLFIHKSYILNELFVSAFQSDYVRLTDGRELPISRLRRKEVMQRQIEIELRGEKE